MVTSQKSKTFQQLLPLLKGTVCMHVYVSHIHPHKQA